MSKLFQGFFHINIGHIAIATIFVFGVGKSWSKYDAKIDTAINTELTHYTALKETDLAASTRIEKAEAQTKDIAALTTAVAVLSTEVKNLSEEVKRLRTHGAAED
jgi:hypothetical protein